jgi:hypothetical protein
MPPWCATFRTGSDSCARPARSLASRSALYMRRRLGPCAYLRCDARRTSINTGSHACRVSGRAGGGGILPARVSIPVNGKLGRMWRRENRLHVNTLVNFHCAGDRRSRAVGRAVPGTNMGRGDRGGAGDGVRAGWVNECKGLIATVTKAIDSLKSPITIRPFRWNSLEPLQIGAPSCQKRKPGAPSQRAGENYPTTPLTTCDHSGRSRTAICRAGSSDRDGTGRSRSSVFPRNGQFDRQWNLPPPVQRLL